VVVRRRHPPVQAWAALQVFADRRRAIPPSSADLRSCSSIHVVGDREEATARTCSRRFSASQPGPDRTARTCRPARRRAVPQHRLAAFTPSAWPDRLIMNGRPAPRRPRSQVPRALRADRRRVEHRTLGRGPTASYTDSPAVPGRRVGARARPLDGACCPLLAAPHRRGRDRARRGRSTAGGKLLAASITERGEADPRRAARRQSA